MKAETLIRVTEAIKADELYLQGKISFTADVIDTTKELNHSYSVEVTMTERQDAFHYMRFAAKFDCGCEFGTMSYIRMNLSKTMVILTIF